MARFLDVFALLCLCGIVKIDAADYCMNTGPLKGQDSTLGAVSLKGEGGTSISTGPFCGPGLNDLTKTAKATVEPGHTYVVNWEGTSCGQSFYKVGKMFIDWERKGWASGDSGASTLQTANVCTPESDPKGTNFKCATTITVPAGISNGPVRMRIMVVESTEMTDVTPCADKFDYGGTTDFTLQIGGEGLSGGSIFLILLLVGVILYIVCFSIYNHKKKGLRGMEVLPHVEFWKSLPGLVKDGCKFTAAKLKSGTTGRKEYENI